MERQTDRVITVGHSPSDRVLMISIYRYSQLKLAGDTCVHIPCILTSSDWYKAETKRHRSISIIIRTMASCATLLLWKFIFITMLNRIPEYVVSGYSSGIKSPLDHRRAPKSSPIATSLKTEITYCNIIILIRGGAKQSP